MKIIIDSQIEVSVVADNPSLASELQPYLPVDTKLGKAGDEIYAIFACDIPLTESAREVFEVGDVIYWCSVDGLRQAVAVFLGNTPVGDGNAPRAVSPADLIGYIDISVFDNFQPQKSMRIQIVQ